ncbi:MAG TPA: hypothetical protein VD713_07015, partial [Sphingomonadales bacterium]|nr:hypothetical protein [Sphingomonadales bacterium]
MVLLLAALSSGEARAEWSFRTVSGQLLDQNGKPVEGQAVLLIGSDRSAVREPKLAAKALGWHFETDAEGRFKARLGCFKAEEYSDKEKAWLPGWGTYFFVVEPGQNHAGAVGPAMQHQEQGGGAAMDEVTLRLQTGINVTGKIQDVNGNAAPDLTLDLTQDFARLGGSDVEIFAASARSDRHGFFEFKNVHPMSFHLGLQSGPPYWIQTRLGGQWTDGIVDEFE